MRNSKIVQKFGEHFVALIFDNLGFEADIVDADGIDLMCYKKVEDSRLSYGVSVKTRNVQFNPNNSINLNWKDIVYADKETKLRGGQETIYALVISKLDEIYVFIFTQEYLFKNYFKNKGIKDIDEYNQNYPSDISGATIGINIGVTAKESWEKLYKNKVEGIVFAGVYRR